MTPLPYLHEEQLQEDVIGIARGWGAQGEIKPHKQKGGWGAQSKPRKRLGRPDKRNGDDTKIIEGTKKVRWFDR